jgi:hypothetical protein
MFLISLTQVDFSSATLAIQPMIYCQRRFREIIVGRHRTTLRILLRRGVPKISQLQSGEEGEHLERNEEHRSCC